MALAVVAGDRVDRSVRPCASELCSEASPVVMACVTNESSSSAIG